MFAKKKIQKAQPSLERDLEVRIVDADLNPSEKAAVGKDLHLIHAAFSADRRIVTLDEEARRAFDKAARRVGRLREIVWVNPCREDESPIEWLERGAPNDEERRLGYRPEPDAPLER